MNIGTEVTRVADLFATLPTVGVVAGLIVAVFVLVQSFGESKIQRRL